MTLKAPRTPLRWLLVLLLGTALAPPVQAQEFTPRFGLGFNTMVSTVDGFGVGFRGRASAPLNLDLSVAMDLGFTGFVLKGRRNATYVFDPQASAIINLPYRTEQLAYVLFGVGAYVPLGQDVDDGDTASAGPTLHAGIGWVRRLNETSIFYELNPALIIGEDGVNLAFPFRLGVIF